MQISVWWIRRDLRLNDNPALEAALQAAEQVLPVFILDPRLLESPYGSEKRLAFFLGGLRALEADLRARGGRLVVRAGRPEAELARLAAELGAAGGDLAGVFAQADHSPYARRRDDRVARRLPLRLLGSPAVYPPGSVLKPDGAPYTVFTPFSRAWKTLPGLAAFSPLPAPPQIATPAEVASLAIPAGPQLPGELPFPPGEAEAQRRLQAFLDGPAQDYHGRRDRLAEAGTSALSPYLRFGMLSPRMAARSALAALPAAPSAGARYGLEAWLNELIWRDFYIHVLHHFPQVRAGNFQPKTIRWENDEGDFAAWCAGCTGYPVVDAGLRQLVASGWMHNRARMLAASFLTKDLLIDWRWGERWFMQHLLDGDPAANNGGWQWTASTGTDAAPYFRVFNPVTQGLKFDPQGLYVRRWIPELGKVPVEFIHEPWKMPDEVQRKAGCRIGLDYPAPRVAHAWARQRALAVFGRAS